MKKLMKSVRRSVQKNSASIRITTSACIALSCVLLVTAGPAFAAPGDPSTTIANFANIMSGVVTAVGVIVVIWGAVQVGLSIQSQDASQRTQGMLAIAGGIVIAAAPWIAQSIL
jgi:hypothetical protein